LLTIVTNTASIIGRLRFQVGGISVEIPLNLARLLEIEFAGKLDDATGLRIAA